MLRSNRFVSGLLVVATILAAVVAAFAVVPVLPAAAAPAEGAAYAPAAQSNDTIYIVKRGDTLFSIARRYGTTVAQLQTYNGIRNANFIWVGQRLRIPVAGGPTPTPPAGAQRIRFATGATFATVEGRVGFGKMNSYVVGASAGQAMMVHLNSRYNNVWLTISGVKDGQVLVRSALGQTYWIGTLPASQDYLIQAVNETGAVTEYTLQVTIPAVIRFQPGAISAVVQGRADTGTPTSYTLRASAGQRMHVWIDSPRDDVLVAVWGLQDGQPLVRNVAGVSEWIGTLPATQDYVIEAWKYGAASTYTLNVAVETVR